MQINIFKTGIFNKDYRRQLVVTLGAILIVICHGIGMGWLSPMLPKLLSEQQTPVDFMIDVNEASWLGAIISLGGLIGNFSTSYIMNRFGRKVALYGLALPNTCTWILIFFAQSIEWLYVSRLCAGLTGGGSFILLPIFIGEISDSSIRGSLSSFFTLGYATGIFLGFIISTHVPYHVIPCIVVCLPLLYLILATRYPETPQQLLLWGQEEAAQRSLKYYCNCDSPMASKESQSAYEKQFDEMRLAIQDKSKNTSNESLTLQDFFNKRALKAILTGIILMIVTIFSGNLAFINYMSNMFERVHTQLDPNTNTIMIGAVQIVGTLVAIYLVDRYGRKPLMIASCLGCTLSEAAFGLYAFYAEQTDVDLSAFAAWLPVTIMALIIFMATVGIVSVSAVILVETLPPKIRVVSTSFCFGFLSVFAFASVKTFPLMMEYLGLSAAMWFCSAVCAFGLVYVVIFLEETKGKSMYE